MISEENVHYIRTFRSVRANYGENGSIAASPGEVRALRNARSMFAACLGDVHHVPKLPILDTVCCCSALSVMVRVSMFIR